MPGRAAAIIGIDRPGSSQSEGGGQLPRRPGRFLGELKRRHVLRVVGVYAVGAWLAIQVADTTFPYLNFPTWSVTAIIILAIIGFPVAIAIAWAFDLTHEGIERAAHTAGEGRAPLALRLATPRLVAMLALIAVTSTAAWLWLRSLRAAAPMMTDTVLVLPFQVSGSGELGYLREGLVDLVARSLEGVAGLRALDPHTSIRIAQAADRSGTIDADHARVLARQVGARYILLGSATEHDQRLVLSARMFDAHSDGLALETPSVEGDASTLFALVAELTANIVVSRFGPASEQLTRSAARTAPSAGALREFLRAEQELRQVAYADAVAGFQRAVAEDSTFALAHYRLAVAAMLNHSGRVAGEAIERARRHAAQLGPRDRRLLDAFAAAHAGRADEAEAAYTAILEEYPDDLEARVQLGGLLAFYNPLRGRPVAEASAHLHRVSALDSAYVCPICMLVNFALHERDLHAADSLMTVRYGDTPLSAYEAGIAAARGDLAGLDRLMPRLEQPGYWQASWVAAFFNRYDLAERLLVAPRPLAELPTQREVAARVAIADLHVARLRWANALEELRRIEAIMPRRAHIRLAFLSLLPFVDRPAAEIEAVRRSLEEWDPELDHRAAAALPLAEYLPLARTYLIGLAHSRLSQPDSARALAVRLERSGEGVGRSLERDLALTIRADVALRSGDAAGTVAVLDSVRAHVPMELIDGATAGPLRVETADLFTLEHARFLRIRALLQLQRPDEALRWIDHGFFRVGGNPLYTPELHLARAEAHDARGADADARESYAHYLALTSSADATLRAVPDRVRARLREGGDAERGRM